MEHTIKTTKQDEMINITEIIRNDVRNCKIKDGLVVVFVPHTTAGITIIEDGMLKLGTWQGIYFCEFDGPRSRRFYTKIIG